MTTFSNPSMHPSTAHSPTPMETVEALADLARAQAQNTLQKIPMLGAATWLMLQQPALRASLLADLEWRVLPPLMLGQARLFMRGDAPVGFASWAFLSDEAASRWRQAPHRLAMADWKSGDQAWLIDVFTPHGGAREMLEELRGTHLAGRELHQLVPLPERSPEELRWPPVVTARKSSPGS